MQILSHRGWWQYSSEKNHLIAFKKEFEYLNYFVIKIILKPLAPFSRFGTLANTRAFSRSCSFQSLRHFAKRQATEIKQACFGLASCFVGD